MTHSQNLVGASFWPYPGWDINVPGAATSVPSFPQPESPGSTLDNSYLQLESIVRVFEIFFIAMW